MESPEWGNNWLKISKVDLWFYHCWEELHTILIKNLQNRSFLYIIVKFVLFFHFMMCPPGCSTYTHILAFSQILKIAKNRAIKIQFTCDIGNHFHMADVKPPYIDIFHSENFWGILTFFHNLRTKSHNFTKI